MNLQITSIPFIDLQAQRDVIGDKIDRAISDVVSHGQFIMGPEVKQLEDRLGTFANMDFALSCSSGTDALSLALMAYGVGPGDAVLVPGFTFAATAEVVALLGATPVFVDVRSDTFNMDPDHLAQTLDELSKRADLTPKVIIAVDLFGLMADYPRLCEIASQYGLKLIADSAQAFGATLNGHQAGEFADVVTTSFFPAKPLGCYGDGGAILTNDGELAGIIRSLRVHGMGAGKYDNVRIGLAARLDTIQAGILLEKLKIFPNEIEMRNTVASRYTSALASRVDVPSIAQGAISTWAQYTIKTGNRHDLASYLRGHGIPTAIYYPKPLHRQTAYCDFPVGGNGLPTSDRLAGEVLSLPMHPYLKPDVQDFVIEKVLDGLGGA